MNPPPPGHSGGVGRTGCAEPRPARVSYSCCIDLLVGELVPAFRVFIRAAKIILSTGQIYSLESGLSVQIGEKL